MIGKILAGVIAVTCAAALTLATMIALVQGTIAAVSLGRRFHGIEANRRSLALARRRIAAYGKRGVET